MLIVSYLRYRAYKILQNVSTKNHSFLGSATKIAKIKKLIYSLGNRIAIKELGQSVY